MNDPIRVLLVDDHVLFRKGVASIMAAQPDLEVAGEASDGFEALEKTRELMPDVILMDINMPGCDGLQATRLIKEELPYAKIVILTVSDEEQALFEAIKSGAIGYLLKNLEPEELFELVRGVSRGEAAISRHTATKILNELGRQSQKDAETSLAKHTLTEREKEVLQLVITGATNKEIASMLFISENTVKNHLCNILDKLHLQNRIQAAAYALREGLISDPRKS
ncbi:MAG: response regulator transcription factor [Chloroflexi bacterium]|nr:response regulator transcription factor [Chloroflexota bacterium]